MDLTPIPGTSLEPSCLCLGTGNYGSGIELQAAFTQMDVFCATGGNFLDTAKVYGDWVPGTQSLSEKVIGEWMKARKNRTTILLATKGAHHNLDTPDVRRVTAEDIKADVEASLEHFKTDYIDLYWLHRDDPSRPIAELVEALEAQVKAGKIRYYGASNWRVDRLREAQAFSQSAGMQGFCGVQNCWSLAHINLEGLFDPTMAVMDQALWQYHAAQQLAAIPYTSQASGIFQKLAAGKREMLPAGARKMFLNPETERRLSRAMIMSRETGLSLTQIVLGYLLSQPFPTIPVFSASNPEQLEDSLSAASTRLTPEQLAFLIED